MKKLKPLLFFLFIFSFVNFIGIDQCNYKKEKEKEKLCIDTGGSWDETSCGDYWCGIPPQCDAIIPGCNCGEGKIFDAELGCIESEECIGVCFTYEECDWGQDCLENYCKEIIECNTEKLPDKDEPADFYEFCVLTEPESYLKDVKSVSEEITCILGSKGRIGCNPEIEYLCMIDKIDAVDQVMCTLSLFPFIEVIKPSFWE